MATTKTTTGSRASGSGTAGASIHDDFYRDLRAKVTAWAKKNKLDGSYRDYVLLVPDLFHFLTRLMMEPSSKVPTRYKAWLGLAVVYVLSPFDFIPDALFPLGLVDDLIVMVVVLDSVLGAIPRSLVTKHWAGSQDLFSVVQESLHKADEWVGKGLFRRIRGYLAKQGLWKDEKNAVVTPPPVPAAPAAVARKKTPSRRPAAKKTTKKAAAKKSTKKKAAKKTAAKKRTVSAKKRTTKKTGANKRTIGPKKTSGSDS